MFNKILVVCVGNICRSPSGERILHKKLPAKHIASAGIATQKSGLVGKGADAMACEVMEQYGIDLSDHKAQQLTPELCHVYDLILVMEKDILKLLLILRLKREEKPCCLGNGLVNVTFQILIARVVKHLNIH